MSTLSTLAPDFLHLRFLFHHDSTASPRTISAAFQLKKRRRRRRLRVVPHASGSGGNSQKKKKKKTWWEKLFYEEDADSWFGANEKNALDDVRGESETDPSEEEKFEAWRKRAEVITELRETQEVAESLDNGRAWEDWLLEESSPGVETSSSWVYDLREEPDVAGGAPRSSEEQFVGTVKNFLFRSYDDELLFEDKVFRYASNRSVRITPTRYFPVFLCSTLYASLL